MAAYLVTGNPGSGKTTLVTELTSRGLVAIDPDYDAELSFWEDDGAHRSSKPTVRPSPMSNGFAHTAGCGAGLGSRTSCGNTRPLYSCVALP
jgi:hypothetical protein